MPQIAQLMEWIRGNSRFVFKQFIVWNKYFQHSKHEGFCKRRLANNQNRNYYGAFTEYCLFYTFQDETGLNKVLKNPAFYPLMDYFKKEREKLKWNYKQCDDFLGIKASYCYWDKPTTHPFRIPEEDHYKKLQTTGYFKRPYESLRQEYESLRQEYESLRQEYEGLRYTFNNQTVMTDDFNKQNWNNNVWNYEIAPKAGHITPKPVDLIENIIRHSSNEGDTVLDCFLGSGTTGVAARNLNRNFIGIELDPDYFKLAEKRIAEASEKLVDEGALELKDDSEGVQLDILAILYEPC
jgi:site-specific DNA-methyltransferase (adenine-specific)